MKNTTSYYAVYDSKSDTIVAYGNAEECSRKLKMNAHTFYSMVSKVKSGKNKKYEIVISRKGEEV